MVEPMTAMIIASAIAAAAKGAGDYISGGKERRAAERRSKETKRETYANLLNDQMERGSDLESHRLRSRNRLGKRRSQSMQETSDLVRGAFKK